MRKSNLIIVALLIAMAVVIRIFSFEGWLPSVANFAPIAAIALFSGVYLGKKYALIVPLIAMVVSDWYIGFYDIVWVIWLSFMLVGMIGWLVRKKKNFYSVTGGVLAGSAVFFTVTNFAVWFAWYPKTWVGLVECYTMALPFFRGTLLGDLFYAGVFFGLYELSAYLIKVGVKRNEKNTIDKRKVCVS